MFNLFRKMLPEKSYDEKILDKRTELLDMNLKRHMACSKKRIENAEYCVNCYRQCTAISRMCIYCTEGNKASKENRFGGIDATIDDYVAIFELGNFNEIVDRINEEKP